MWKAAYPDQARKHSFPYTRYSLLLQCYEALSAHPFVAAGQGDSLSGTLDRLTGRLETQSKTLQDTLRRLPSAKEMKVRNDGKKSQEILIGDQAQAGA